MSFIKHRLPTLFALALLLTPGLAAAAEPGDPWQVALGAGLSTRPQYPGSDDTRLQPLPIFDISYRNRWFLRSSDGLGAYLVRGENCWISASVTPDLTRRRETDDTRLRGLGSVHETARAMLKAGYRLGWLSGTVAASSDIAGQRQGTLLDFELDARQALTERLQFEGGIGARWANRQYNSSFFGIDAQQSAASGLPQYAAGSGFSDLRAFVGASYGIDQHWSASARITAARLVGDDAGSPITERKLFTGFAAFAVYHF